MILKASTRYITLLAALLLVGNSLIAQRDTTLLDSLQIPLNRQLAHENIDREQVKALQFKTDTSGSIHFSNDALVNQQLQQSLTRDIDWIQYDIEKDSLLNHNKRLYYLRGLQNMLRYLVNGWRSKQLNPLDVPKVITAYQEAIRIDESQQSIAPLIATLDYGVAIAVVRSTGFDGNAGMKDARDQVVLKYCLANPSLTFPTLKDNPDLPFADSLIRLMARRYPLQLYSFAQSTGTLGNLIRGIRDDSFIRTVSDMSGSRSGQQYFPFLDNIVNGKISIAAIDSIKDDSLQYFRLLVSTQMDYVRRAIEGDTAYEFKSLTDRLAVKAKDEFVNTINGLHELSDPVRFRCLQNLTAPELYYLAVLTDGLIYTSSYTRGVFPLMMKRVNNRGDSLLVQLRFDHYRKFISQAAAYNTLSGFLNSFSNPEDAKALMQAFTGNLEKTTGLEDGVDVADSYASIREANPALAGDVLQLVKQNYQRNIDSNDQRGIHIYDILTKLFLSADSSNNIDLTKELGIPPVYNIPYSSLVNDSGVVIGQVFFYGDKDTREIDYPEFVEMFNNSNWTIDRSQPQWIVIRSAKGKPVAIYANKPFFEETGEDDLAQRALGEYLEKNNLHPVLTIHRGHSYFANSTIGYMSPNSRIVFMGSCGGFHVIDSILHKSEDAHIIASRQIGMRAVNKPFFRLLTEKLRTGSNIDWIPFWKEFSNSARVEGFEDYVPPYKNLGAIFIKAYRKAMEKSL